MAKHAGIGRELPLWVAPTIGMVVALALGAGVLAVDALVDWPDWALFAFRGEAETARTLLGAIAGAVATLIALIFTIVAVVIQLASGQYSPRALYTLLQDRPSHLTIGVFVGTFTYALVVLLGLPIAAMGDGGDISSLAVTLAFGFAVGSLVNFAIYANHIIHSVRISSILERLGSEARVAIDDLFPKRLTADASEPAMAPDGEPEHEVRADEPGVLVALDTDALLAEAVANDAVIVVVPPLGAFVPSGGTLIEVHGPHDRAASLRRHLRLEAQPAPERWALRNLTDIAERALSPGINDPATAVQALDQLHDLLRRLVGRDFAVGSRLEADGTIRVYVPVKRWEDIVSQSLDEIRVVATGSLPAVRRLRAVLEDLLAVAPAVRKPALRTQLELLDAGVDRAFDDQATLDAARRPDTTGTQL